MPFLNFLAINALRNRYLSDDDGWTLIRDLRERLCSPLDRSCSSELLPSAIP